MFTFASSSNSFPIFRSDNPCWSSGGGELLNQFGKELSYLSLSKFTHPLCSLSIHIEHFLGAETYKGLTLFKMHQEYHFSSTPEHLHVAPLSSFGLVRVWWLCSIDKGGRVEWQRDKNGKKRRRGKIIQEERGKEWREEGKKRTGRTIKIYPPESPVLCPMLHGHPLRQLRGMKPSRYSM